MVADFIGGIRQHQDDLFASGGDTAQTDGKAVAAQDRKYDTDASVAGIGEFGFDIGRDLFDGGVVALRTGDNRFGYRDDVAVAQLKTFDVGGVQDGCGYDACQIIALADDGAADAA